MAGACKKTQNQELLFYHKTMREKLVFFMPLWYTYYTRLRSPMKCLSLFFIYLIPVSFLFFTEVSWEAFSFRGVLLLLLSIMALYNTYEIGYIQNDTETIELEVTPTCRLTEAQLVFYHENRFFIYTWRVLLSIILVGCLAIYVNLLGILLFLGVLLLILLTYQLYNRIRNHLNMLLYFVLVSLRYLAPLILLIDCLSFKLCLSVWMIFPIVKTLEFRSTKPASVTTNIYFRKYILRFDKSRLTGYRAIAYVLLTLFSLLLYVVDYFPITYVIPVAYMMLYRLGIYILIKLGMKPKEYLKG